MVDNLKILILNDYRTATGGADRMALAMADELTALGHNTIFWAPQDVVGLSYSKSPRFIMQNFFNFRIFYTLRKLIQNEAPEIIVVHSWTKQLSISCIWATQNIPTYIVTHDYFLTCPNGGQFNYSTRMLCPLNGGSFQCLTTNCDKNNYRTKLYRTVRFYLQSWILQHIKPNVVCLNRTQMKMFAKHKLNCQYVPNSLRYLTGVVQGSCGDEILYVGRPDPEKGLDRVLDASIGSKLKFSIVGPDHDTSGLAGPNVTFLGWKSGPEIEEQFHKARLLVFPSRWLEVDPLVPLEACANGVPVYCSSDNVFADTLNAYGLGDFIFKTDTDLKKNLNAMYERSGDPKLRKKFRELFDSENKLREGFITHEVTY